MAARALVFVVAIAFIPSCCTASYDEPHDCGMVEESHLVLLQTAMQAHGTQAKAKQPDPGRVVHSANSDATCMMMGDGVCTEPLGSFSGISIASSTSSIDTPADADASIGADDIATDSETMPSSSKSSPLRSFFKLLTSLVLLNMLCLWYVGKSGDNPEDGLSRTETSHGEAVGDNEETPLMDLSTTSGSSSRGASAGVAASYEDVAPLLERCKLEQVDYPHTACGDSADVPADLVPAREGALQSLIALMSKVGDKAETLGATDEFPDDSEDMFETGWDGWTWKAAAEATAGVA